MEKEVNHSSFPKCKKCEGELYKTDNLHGIAGNRDDNGSYDIPTIPEYECKKCKSIFGADQLDLI